MKKEKKILFRNYIILAILIFVIFNVLYSLTRNFILYNEWSKKYDYLDSQIKEEENKYENNNEKKENIKTKNGAEKELLDKYILQKPGEKIIEILD